MPPVNNQPTAPYGGAPIAPLPTGLPGKSKGKLIFITIILGVLFVFTLLFAFYAFAQMQDYKNNSDAISAKAVVAAEAAQESKLNAEFAEKEKSPYKTYQSSADFGSVKIVYPKLWGSYVQEIAEGGMPVNGFFHPNFVPQTEGLLPIALRVQVVSIPYDQSLREFEGNVTAGTVKASPVKIDGVKNVTGMRFDGKITPNFSGSIVMFPMRDKTLKIWTEIPSNVSDLNNIVLKNLSFSP